MCRHRFGTILAVLLLAAVPAVGAELTVEELVTVTIARLELQETTWGEEGRSPTAAEEDDLFEDHGTIAEIYYRFAGKNREAVETYLEDRPVLRNRIEASSERVRQLIEQREED